MRGQKHCKPSACLVVMGVGGDANAAFCFFGEVSQVLSAVFLVLHLGKMRAGEGRVTAGHLRFSPERQLLSLFKLIFFLAPHHSLSWLYWTGQTNYENDLCLMSASYIYFPLNNNWLLQYATFKPSISTYLAIDSWTTHIHVHITRRLSLSHTNDELHNKLTHKQ